MRAGEHDRAGPPWKDAFVPGIRRTMVSTSEGEVGLPIDYGPSMYVMAAFRVANARARHLAEPFGLNALGLPKATSLVVLSFADYRDSTIGPYRESGLAVAALPAGANPSIPSLLSLWRSRPGQRGIGYAVLQLPVTSRLACAAGREIWGYPKFVTDIEATLSGPTLRGEVRAPSTGRCLLRLAGRTGLAVPSRALDYVLYSRIDGILLQARVESHGFGWLCLPGSVRLSIASGEHPMARTLDLLGLHGARPAVVFRAPGLRMRLHDGKAVST